MWWLSILSKLDRFFFYFLLHAVQYIDNQLITRGYLPMQNVKLNHYIAVFERVVLLCKICEQQTSNRIESLAIESGCIRG